MTLAFDKKTVTFNWPTIFFLIVLLDNYHDYSSSETAMFCQFPLKSLTKVWLFLQISVIRIFFFHLSIYETDMMWNQHVETYYFRIKDLCIMSFVCSCNRASKEVFQTLPLFFDHKESFPVSHILSVLWFHNMIH